MPKIDVYNIEGKKVKEVELKEEIFGIEPNEAIVHSVLVNYLANQRQGTQSTKTRAEVRGGGRKPWRQKGTGRARQGSIRAPQWIKGGIALGPKPRSYYYTVNKKEKRLAIRRYTKDKSVLDCFCNSGGFSMNAATNAKSVKAVDISKSALDTVKRNVELNSFKNVTTLEGDVFKVLRDEKTLGNKYDVVILDPPAFCKSINEIKDSLRGYKDINILGMKLVEKGGILVSSSCTHFITEQMFMNMLRDASRESGRKVRVVEIKTQAPDHPALLCDDETSYLKFVVLQVL